jgi:hypothetical protein
MTLPYWAASTNTEVGDDNDNPEKAKDSERACD